jgi:DNA ligase 1
VLLFTRLYHEIDATNKTNEKVAAMARYFREAPPADAAWAVHFLIGRRPKRLVPMPKLWGWANAAAGIPDWLFAECHDAVGDFAETVALVLPDPPDTPERELAGALPLHVWVEERLLPLAGADEEAQREAMLRAWADLDRPGRFVWNKLITGAFRVGVSQDLVVRALSDASGVPAATLAHRLMGPWEPTAEFFSALLNPDPGDAQISRPYPFCLAHPLEADPETLGDVREWHAEWKWDGIRAQVIRREGRCFVWSRGEDLITERFPEIERVAEELPDGTVLDGEILGWGDGKPIRFLDFQRRIGRKALTKKILEEIPAMLVAFDLLEEGGEDLRERPFEERRERLERAVKAVRERFPLEEPRVRVSTSVRAQSWEEMRALREEARERNVEGLMLKRCDSPYLVGRKKGLWWKWKIDPFTLDAVLIYAQQGSGRRASLFTDYTFGVWDDGRLVPIAKAYSGLSDEEIREVDRFVRNNTLERHGPVRVVRPELVMELAFEAIQLSSRHKSGVAVRFPRIARLRPDKRPDQADTLEGVKELLKLHG